LHGFIGELLANMTQVSDVAPGPLVHEVMALGLRKISRILSFPHFFCSCFQIIIWYLVHCFDISRYRSSLSLVLIYWFFMKLWPLDLEKYHEFSVFCTFFVCAFRYSFDIWYIALTYQDTYQVWVWFWSIDFSRGYDP
jgi:hypothetical protein